MPTMQEKRDAAINSAKETTLRAKDAGRDLTADEVSFCKEQIATAEACGAHLKAVEKSNDLLRQLSESGMEVESMNDLDPGGQPLIPRTLSKSATHLKLTGDSGRRSAAALAGRMVAASGSSKGLLPAGSVLGPVALLPGNELTAEPRPASGLLSTLRAVISSPNYSYLRQVTRTNNAAPVAAGDLKPTSLYGLEKIEGRLRVIAHLSEPIDSYWLRDTEALQQFVSDELLFGLDRAVVGQVLAGTGVGEQIAGILETTGVQVQPFTVDGLTTTRAAVTKLEVLGFAPAWFAMHPLDWEAIEVSTASGSGQYVMASSPVDRAARRLWGVPVVVTPELDPGTGILADAGAVSLLTDTAVKIEWGTIGDDFAKNLMRARCEGRFDVAVTQPAGIVIARLTATP